MQNIDNYYVVPLDWRFCNHLQGSITTRIYEFFSMHFFVALEKKREYHDARYKGICEYFPLVLQYPGWKARKQLKQAHELLTKAGYFSKVEWFETSELDDWTIRYWIGPRARSEYDRNRSEVRKIGDNAKPVPFPERRRRRQLTTGDENNNAPEAQKPPLERDLVEEWGMTASTAQTLLKTHSESRIREVMAWARVWAKGQKASLDTKKSGWLDQKMPGRKLGAPTGYVSADELSKQKHDREAREAEQKAQIEAQRREEDWRAWYTMTPKQRVLGELWAWTAEYKREHNGKEPSKEEYENREAELIAMLPSNTEKQQQLFGHIKYPDQI